MKVPSIRIVWAVATIVIYLGFKIYDFYFPLILLNVFPMILLWFAVRRDGIDFFSGPKNYLLFFLVVFSGILLEHFVFYLLPPEGAYRRLISMAISLAVLASVIFYAKWSREKKLQHP